MVAIVVTTASREYANESECGKARLRQSMGSCLKRSNDEHGLCAPSLYLSHYGVIPALVLFNLIFRDRRSHTISLYNSATSLHTVAGCTSIISLTVPHPAAACAVSTLSHPWGSLFSAAPSSFSPRLVPRCVAFSP